MGAPKPTLGYRSRTEAVLALRSAGVTDKQVASRVGIDVSTVAALACSGRRAVQGNGRSRDQATVVFPKELLFRLRPAARKRNIGVNELARQIVEAAVESNIVDAVLDDMETWTFEPRPKRSAA